MVIYVGTTIAINWVLTILREAIWYAMHHYEATLHMRFVLCIRHCKWSDTSVYICTYLVYTFMYVHRKETLLNLIGKIQKCMGKRSTSTGNYLVINS